MIVSGTQLNDSVLCIHVSILPQTPLQSRLPHNIEQCSLCYTVSPCWSSILNIAVCTLDIILFYGLFKLGKIGNTLPPASVYGVT